MIGSQPSPTHPASSTLSTPILPVLYAGAIVVAGLYFGRELIVPLVLASLLAFVLAPACNLLQKARLPRVVAVMIVVLLAFAIIGGIGSVVARQAASLAGDLPTYQSTVQTKWQALSQGNGFLAHALRGMISKQDAAAPASSAVSALGLSEMSSVALARTFAQPLLGPLETGGIVLVFTIFILLSSSDLRDRLVRLLGRHDLHRTILAMNDAARRLSHYFVYQLALNTGFGVLIGASLWVAGLPNPLLWGILAALMRFVPYVGVFIALAPPLLLAVAIVPGWSLALIVLALFVAGELMMGQVIEPLTYGHSTGLSALAIIVATAFWALLWGPIGLLLATPLTVCLVVIGNHVEALSFLAVILGDRPPLEPPEIFYQRALEGRASSLLPAARQRIEASSLTDYYDQVALPGLALAQVDLTSDERAFERLEDIHAQIETLLAKVEQAGWSRGEGANAAPRSGDGQAAGSILCLPGRGQLDDLAGSMAVQAMLGAGFDARFGSNLVLGSHKAAADLSDVRLCCLSVLEEGSSVTAIRYFIRRIEKRMPNAVVVVGLWHAGRGSPVLAELRAGGGNEHIVRSVGELVASVRARMVDAGLPMTEFVDRTTATAGSR